MRKGVKLVVLFGALVAIGGVFVVALNDSIDKSNQALLERSFPQFSLPNLTQPEQLVSNQVFATQEWTLVNVWASWCGVCLSEHDYLHTLADSGIPILGINYRDKVSSAAQYLHTQGNPYQKIAFDPNAELALKLGVIGTPESILVDRQGKIQVRHLGKLTPDAWQHKFVSVMTGKKN
ncbi:DsbE family thiol:disulfide interchange protein [Vibrio sp. SCSIO 43136]|uniref:DsbE family thiol:disulfide interchange protein n=1 Tax=Vibrio sp. SCSIO 43136 TaxID=2819101 RepID=UPI0020752BC5|nr:DsbE family thiol:disulfide interchange protein [Vibrio sp. SCSIO 43136]USD66386.1 DsbE family thiol:disulfide interchange protein [Vibrio sp. SCSIO 43136]